jgi:hypothetical protein
MALMMAVRTVNPMSSRLYGTRIRERRRPGCLFAGMNSPVGSAVERVIPMTPFSYFPIPKFMPATTLAIPGDERAAGDDVRRVIHLLADRDRHRMRGREEGLA